MTPPAQKTVLVVEDDPDIRGAVEELLDLEGYRVLTARNGREALDRMGALSHPCLVLLDLRMPVMDGHALLRRMKELRDFESVPVVVMTAEHEPESELDDAEDVLHKPFRLSQLLEAVDHNCH